MLRGSSFRFFFGSFGGFFGSVGSSGGSSGFKSFGSSLGGENGPGGVLNSFMNKALEWCSTSHAHDIARQEGIDMKDIRFEYLKDGSVRVFIEAPNATQQQIERLGERVEAECPVARFRKAKVEGKGDGAKMKWLRLSDKYDR